MLLRSDVPLRGQLFFVSIDAAAHCEKVPISFQHNRKTTMNMVFQDTNMSGFSFKRRAVFVFGGCNSLFYKSADGFLRCREVLGT